MEGRRRLIKSSCLKCKHEYETAHRKETGADAPVARTQRDAEKYTNGVSSDRCSKIRQWKTENTFKKRNHFYVGMRRV